MKPCPVPARPRTPEAGRGRDRSPGRTHHPPRSANTSTTSTGRSAAHRRLITRAHPSPAPPDPPAPPAASRPSLPAAPRQAAWRLGPLVPWRRRKRRREIKCVPRSDVFLPEFDRGGAPKDSSFGASSWTWASAPAATTARSRSCAANGARTGRNGRVITPPVAACSGSTRRRPSASRHSLRTGPRTGPWQLARPAGTARGGFLSASRRSSASSMLATYAARRGRFSRTTTPHPRLGGGSCGFEVTIEARYNKSCG